MQSISGEKERERERDADTGGRAYPLGKASESLPSYRHPRTIVPWECDDRDSLHIIEKAVFSC